MLRKLWDFEDYTKIESEELKNTTRFEMGEPRSRENVKNFKIAES